MAEVSTPSVCFPETSTVKPLELQCGTHSKQTAFQHQSLPEWFEEGVQQKRNRPYDEFGNRRNPKHFQKSGLAPLLVLSELRDDSILPR